MFHAYRYRLQFAAESPEALASQKLRAQREAIVPIPMEKREYSVEDFYPEQASQLRMSLAMWI